MIDNEIHDHRGNSGLAGPPLIETLLLLATSTTTILRTLKMISPGHRPSVEDLMIAKIFLVWR